MSATIDVPKGLDALDASDMALIESMRADDGAPPSNSGAPVAPEAPPAATAPAEEPVDLEIDIPDGPAEPVTAERTKMVPHAQFHAAREQLKAQRLKAEAADAARIAAETKLATETAKINERVEMLARFASLPAATATAPTPAAEAAPAPVEIPDVTTDPVGHFRAVAEQQAAEVAALKGMMNGFQENQRAAQQAAEMRNWGVAQEVAFEAQEPSYRAAMEHLKQTRHIELETIGVTDPTERERIIAQDVNQIAHRSRREGANFAERLYKVALSRGFAKAAPAAPAAPASPVIPALDAIPAPAPAERAARLEEGRENSTTIGSLGSAPGVKLSVAKIADMSDSQFAALLKKMEGNPTALRDLMGH